jgi:hypothetical protein
MRNGRRFAITGIVAYENEHACEQLRTTWLLRSASGPDSRCASRAASEWIEKNGDCPTCESYESRFAELLNIFQSHERESAA